MGHVDHTVNGVEALKITITNAGGVDNEPRLIKIFAVEFLPDAEAKWHELSTFIWPETKSFVISPMANNTRYHARSFSVDN